MFIAFAIRATDRTALSNSYDPVIATGKKTSANSQPRTLFTHTSGCVHNASHERDGAIFEVPKAEARPVTKDLA